MDNQEAHNQMTHETQEKATYKKTSWKKWKEVQTRSQILKRNFKNKVVSSMEVFPFLLHHVEGITF